MLPEPFNTIKKKPIISLYIAGAVLLLACGLLWFFKVSIGPERVFWGALEQSLSTSAVTIEADQSNQNASLHQTIQYSLGATNMTHSRSTVTQGGTTIVNELVGTPQADYTRYISVKTDQKGKDGKPLDFSHILGVWAKGEDGQAQLFSQSVLGVGLPLGGVAMPIANLQPTERAKLVDEIKDDVVYQVDFKKVKSQRKDGRLQYVYDVSVQPVAYANLMQQFAKAVGLHDLDSLDPAQFRGQKATEMRLTVDARAKRLVAAEAIGTGAKQTYTSYGVTSSFEVPKKTVTVQELQTRLSQLQ